MKKDLLLMWHLGLGDTILCNGLLRTLHQEYNITTFCKHHNFNTTKIMFDDLEDLTLIKVKDDNEAIKFVNDYKKFHDRYLGLGFFGKDFMKNTKYFDESFYNQAEVNYFNRWNKFHFPFKEKSQIRETTKENYIFVHDDHSRGLVIKDEYLENKNIFRPRHNLGKKSDHTLFDYLNIIKNSTEIHCMDSSFACLIEHIDELREKKKYIHRYIRKQNKNPKFLNNWKILND